MPPHLIVDKLTRYHDRTMASVIVDDLTATTPADAAAFARFSGWVRDHGLRGECSAILGLRRDEAGRALPLDADWCREVAAAATTHLDAYMEVMTHSTVYDFEADRAPSDGQHESVWLLDRQRTQADYASYLGAIADRAHDLGLRHAGLTWPGCGCEACAAVRQGLGIRRLMATDFNPGLLAALLDLLRAGRLAGPLAGLFVGTVGQGPADATVLVEEGPFAVYDVPPGVSHDKFGRWDNDPAYIDCDYYLTADGQRGRFAQLLALQSPTMICYGHWQSLRPDQGLGWATFQEVIGRVTEHRGAEVVWLRPTEIAAYRHTERHTEVWPTDQGFALRIPFTPPHDLTLRLRGAQVAELTSPSGVTLKPWRQEAGGATLFDVWPEPGEYRCRLV